MRAHSFWKWYDIDLLRLWNWRCGALALDALATNGNVIWFVNGFALDFFSTLARLAIITRPQHTINSTHPEFASARFFDYCAKTLSESRLIHPSHHSSEHLIADDNGILGDRDVLGLKRLEKRVKDHQRRRGQVRLADKGEIGGEKYRPLSTPRG